MSRYRNTSVAQRHRAHGELRCSAPVDPDISAHWSAKRRKIAGHNARFDRMINSVNTIFSCRNDTPAGSRKRMQSSGTSSVSSHDVPETPVDAYSSLHPGELGKDFSVLKMRNSPLLPWKDPDGCPKLAARPVESRSRLPDWLADTFCSLEAGHPLRGLLSPPRINTESKANFPVAHLFGASHEDELFAFSPFEFDKQGEVPGAAYRTQSTLTMQEGVSSVVPTKPTPSHLQLEADALPFSTPGRFAPFRRPMESPIVDGTLQKPVVPVPQQVNSNTTNTMHPPVLPSSHLRLDSEMEMSQFTRALSGIVQDDGPSSDFQDHGACMNHNYRVVRNGDNNFNVYATPGPTFSCSHPVYFDSPTEDPSLFDPLQSDSYGLHISTIDFRWHPFLRSNSQESDMNRCSVSPSSPLEYSVPSQVGGQDGWGAGLAVDRGEYGASSEGFPPLREDMEVACLDGVAAVLPSNVNTSIPDNLTRSWSSPIGDVLRQATPSFAFAPGAFLSPLRDQPESASLAADNVSSRDEENIHPGEELSLLHDEETKAIDSEACGVRVSTPIRQVPVTPPSAPQKVRSSQLGGMQRTPVRNTSSALSWMIPLRSSKRTITTLGDVDCLLRVAANSHDSIESWSES